MNYKDIVISVSCYDNENEIVDFAKQLSEQRESDKIVLLVCCNKCDNIEFFKSNLLKTNINVEVFEPEDNLGYLNGGLYALKTSKYVYKWAIICNTDLAFPESDFFERILSTKYSNDIWMVAPNIIRLSNGVRQNPFQLRRLSDRKMRLLCSIYNHELTYCMYFWLSSVKRKIIKNEVPYVCSQNIYAADGSCFIMKKEFISEIQKIDNNIFMYGEEIFLAEIINAKEKYVYFDENMNLIHKGNATTKYVHSRQKYLWFKQSFSYIYKYFYKKQSYIS